MSGPVIAVKFRAGQAEFFEDLTKIKVGVRQFGSEMEGAGHAGVSGFQATSATLRVMEGGLTNNLRAAERFASSVLGLGPLLQAAFPLVGGLAFVGLLDSMGQKLVKFYTDVRDGGDKMRAGFHEADDSINLTNDSLRVSIAELDQANAKLRGEPENGLALAIAQARKEADSLGESLDKDIKKVYDLEKENTGDWESRLVNTASGNASTADIPHWLGGDDGNTGFRASTWGMTPAQMADAYKAGIAALQAQIQTAQAYQNEQASKKPGLFGTVITPDYGIKDLSGNAITGDMSRRIATLQEVIHNLQQQVEQINLTKQEGAAKGENDKLKVLEAAAKLDKENGEMWDRLLEKEIGIVAAFKALDDKVKDSNDKLADTMLRSDIREKIQMAKVTEPLTVGGQTYIDPQDLLAHQRNLRAISLNTDAANNLAGAAFGGQDATNRAELENKIAEAKDKNAKEDEFAAMRLEDQARYSAQIVEQAARLATIDSNNLETLGQEIDVLQKEHALKSDDLQITAAIKDLEDQRLRLASQMALEQGSLRDGMRAFFLEMQEQSEKTGKILDDALNSAVDQTSENLAKLMTGQGKKSQWADEFKSIGTKMLGSAIKSELETALGSLGKKMGIHPPGVFKPTGAANNPFYVNVLNGCGGGEASSPGALSTLPPMGSTAATGPGSPGWGNGGLLGTGQVPKYSGFGQTLVNAIGGLFGGGGGGGGNGTDVSSSISYGGGMAAGGPVEPGSAYLISDSKDDEYFLPKSRGSIVPAGKGSGDGGVSITNNIDARGSDLGVVNRLHRAMEERSRQATVDAIQAQHEHSKRVPQ